MSDYRVLAKGERSKETQADLAAEVRVRLPGAELVVGDKTQVCITAGEAATYEIGQDGARRVGSGGEPD